jgi:hypothetical protein
MLRHITEDEKVWRYYSQHRIQGMQAISTHTSIEDLKRIFVFPTYKTLYTSFRFLTTNLTGFFRLMPPFQQMNGGLCAARIVNDDFIVQCINSNGFVISNDLTFKIKYSTDFQKLICTTLGSNFKMFSFSINKNNAFIFIEIMINYTNGTYKLNTIPTLVLKQLPASYSPESLQFHRIFDLLQNNFVFNNLGLYVGQYGSHGKEILHLSVHNSFSNQFLHDVNYNYYDHNNYSNTINNIFNNNNNNLNNKLSQFGKLQLHGLKISGDVNVPASKLSFIIDLENIVDIQRAVQEDNRPIVMFQENLQPTLVSIENKFPNMVLWAKGYGQINRNKNVWCPEWVKCSFILFKNNNNNNNYNNNSNYTNNNSYNNNNNNNNPNNIFNNVATKQNNNNNYNNNNYNNNNYNNNSNENKFSILWDDDSEHFRHTMDFFPFEFKS